MMKLTFTLPDGFEMPPDAEVGGQFQAVGTFQDNGDGTITLTQIDGSDIEMEEGEMHRYGKKGKDSEDGEGYGPKAKMEVEMEAEGPGAENLFAKAKKAGIPMKM